MTGPADGLATTLERTVVQRGALSVPGREVVQVYLSRAHGAVERPARDFPSGERLSRRFYCRTSRARGIGAASR